MFKLYLPPSYSTDSRAFPSVYVQDGGSLFQDQLELIENRFHQNRVPELVLIGIEPKTGSPSILLGPPHHSAISFQTSAVRRLTIFLK